MSSVNKKVDKLICLKNKYNGDEVYALSLEVERKDGNVEFIRVVDKRDPKRTYLVNREAFQIVSK